MSISSSTAEVDVLGSPFETVHGVCGRKAPWNVARSITAEVDALGSPSLIVHTVSVDLKHHRTLLDQFLFPLAEVDVLGGLPVPNSLYCLSVLA